jgi:hypothetical protein
MGEGGNEVKNEKCGNGKLCDDLAKRAYPYEKNARGFVAVRHITIKQMSERQIGLDDSVVSGIGYKETAKDKGVMLNYCPFCGEKIDWFREKEAGSEA